MTIQDLLCKFGFHKGKWGEGFTREIHWKNKIMPWDNSLEYVQFIPSQRRICSNCNAESVRKIW